MQRHHHHCARQTKHLPTLLLPALFGSAALIGLTSCTREEERETTKPRYFSQSELVKAVAKCNGNTIKEFLHSKDCDINQRCGVSPNEARGFSTRTNMTLLSYAVCKNEPYILELFLAAPSIDINAYDSEYRKTALVWAAELGHTECAKRLLAAPRINTNAGGPLAIAARAGNMEIAKLLLAAPDVDINFNFPLTKAVCADNIEMVKLLLAAPGIDVNAGEPLPRAVQEGNIEMVKLLLAAPGINVNAENPLAKAARDGNIEMVKLLLTAPGINVNAGEPLARAVREGNIEMIKLLLAAPGINVNAGEPLAKAARDGNIEIAKLLLAAPGIDVNAGEPLPRAVQEGNIEIAKLLLAAPGIDVNEGEPLAKAVQEGNIEMVKLLLAAPGIDVNAGNPLAEAIRLRYIKQAKDIIKLLLSRPELTPPPYSQLHIAILRNDIETTIQLLANKHDINAADATGRTPLRLALDLEYPELARLLLAQPEIKICNDDWIDYATSLDPIDNPCDAETIKLLFKAPGFDVNATDTRGVPLLTDLLYNWCSCKENMEIVKLLLTHPNIEVNKPQDVEKAKRNNRKYMEAYTPLDIIQGYGDDVLQLLRAAGCKKSEEIEELTKTWTQLFEKQHYRDKLSPAEFSYAKSYFIAHGFNVKLAGNLFSVYPGEDKVINYLLAGIPNLDANLHTPLYYAARCGNLHMVKLLLAIPGVDVNLLSEYRESPLFVAAANRHTEVVKFLLTEPGIDTQINVNQRQINDWTYGTEYCSPSQFPEIMTLLQQAHRFKEEPRLFQAIREGDVNNVKEILRWERRDAVNEKSITGKTPLTLAVETGNTQIVKAILDTDNVDINQGNIYGFTPLLLAIQTNNAEIVKLLLKNKNIDINKANIHKFTPLLLAAKIGNIEIVKLLIEYSKEHPSTPLDFETPYQEHWTPYEMALLHKHYEVAQLLADEHRIDISDETSLVYAVMTHNVALTKWLIARQLNTINKSDVYGHTPLTCAATRGYTDLVQLLLSTDGIDVNSTNKYGFTALTCAAIAGHTDIVKLLLAAPGIDVNLRGSREIESAIYYAKHYEYTDIEELLRAAGADEDLEQDDKDYDFIDLE